MKLVTYSKQGKEQLAFLIENTLYDTNAANSSLPGTMSDLLNNWENQIEAMRAAEQELKAGKTQAAGTDYSSAEIMAPVPKPTSCRRAGVPISSRPTIA